MNNSVYTYNTKIYTIFLVTTPFLHRDVKIRTSFHHPCIRQVSAK